MRQYPYVFCDAYVIMPNHLHAILVISRETGCRGGSRTAPTEGTIKPLGRLIGAFKTVSTKRINEMNNTPGRTFWQRNYYEHVIRGGDDHERIKKYIQGNPMNWPQDDENPGRI